MDRLLTTLPSADSLAGVMPASGAHIATPSQLPSLTYEACLRWKEELSVGNDAIDSDHKHFIEIVNQAENNLAAMDQAALKTNLENLFFYALTHFDKEEKIAHAVGYPQVQSLHDSHEELRSKLLQIEREIDEAWSPSSIEDFSTLLRDWLLNHVLEEDMLMKPFLTKYSPNFDPGKVYF